MSSRSSTWIRGVAVAGTSAFSLAQSAGAAVTLVSNPDPAGPNSYIRAVAFDIPTAAEGPESGVVLPGPDTQTAPLITVPSDVTVTATQGRSTSTVAAALSQSSFAFTLNQFTPGGFGAGTAGSGRVFFTVSTDTLFSISGTFATTPPITFAAPPGDGEIAFAPSTSGGPAVLSAYLIDLAAPPADPNLYTSNNAGNLGDTLNLAPGQGTLLAGHTYEFGFYSSMNFELDPVGTGNVNLAFAPINNPGGGPNPVPLPAAAWAGLVLGGAAIRSARKRRGAR